MVAGDPFPGAAGAAWSVAAGLMSVTAVAAFYFALAHGAMTVVAPITAVVRAAEPVAVGLATGSGRRRWRSSVRVRTNRCPSSRGSSGVNDHHRMISRAP